MEGVGGGRGRWVSSGAAIEERKLSSLSARGEANSGRGESVLLPPHSVALGLHSKDWSRLARGSTLLNVVGRKGYAVDNHRITITKPQCSQRTTWPRMLAETTKEC